MSTYPVRISLFFHKNFMAANGLLFRVEFIFLNRNLRITAA